MSEAEAHKILVGIDGSERGKRALCWAAARAVRDGSDLTLLLVIDSRFTQGSQRGADTVREAADDALARAAELVAARAPQVRARAVSLEGKVLDSIVDAAKTHDLVVLGSHHGSSVGENIGGAKGLRVAVSTTTPTAVVPADWTPESAGTGVVVGVALDDSSDAAIAFGTREALATGQQLQLVSTWGLPAFLARPAKAMGGEFSEVGIQYQQRLDALVGKLRQAHPGLEVTGKAVEGPSPTKTMLECCKGRSLLVLGTRTTSALGRTLFGSLAHSVLMNLEIPTVVVGKD